MAGALAASSAVILLQGLHNGGTGDETVPPGPHGTSFWVASYLAIGVTCLSLPARRQHPVAVLILTLAGQAALLALGVRVPAIVAAGFAMYSVTATARLRTPYALVPCGIGALAAASVASPDRWTVETLIFASGAILVGWLAGENSRARERYALALARSAAAHERERARHAATEERARIARELHDVVAHAMSVIAVRSGVARVISRSQPEQAIESLEIIENVSRRSLRELRRIVAVLRKPDETCGEDLGPAPSLTDLPDLVNQIAAAGVSVDLRVEGQARQLPLTEDLSAYRIAQEALTNVVHHSGADTATLCVRYAHGSVEVECLDPGGDRRRRSCADHAGGGHGLVGMRERVALCGGDFTAGRAGRGFRVRARIPVAEEVK